MNRVSLVALLCSMVMSGCFESNEPEADEGGPFDGLAELIAEDDTLQDAVSSALLDSPSFTERLIGQLLLDPGFVAALKGDPGADASPEDVARELLADEDFKDELTELLLEDDTLMASVAQFLVDNHLEDIQGPPGMDGIGGTDNSGPAPRRIAIEPITGSGMFIGGSNVLPDLNLNFEKRDDSSLLRVEWRARLLSSRAGCIYRVVMNGRADLCKISFIHSEGDSGFQFAQVTDYCQVSAGQYNVSLQVEVVGNNFPQCQIVERLGREDFPGMLAVEEIAVAP